MKQKPFTSKSNPDPRHNRIVAALIAIGYRVQPRPIKGAVFPRYISNEQGAQA